MTFPLPGGNWSYLHSLRLVATTGPAGFTLVNGTPNILTWTAPNDGNMHRLLLFCEMHVTSALTGGQVDVTLTMPDGSAVTVQLIAASSGPGLIRITNSVYLLQAGATFTLQEFTAVTLGAAVLWAEIWAL